MRSGQHLALHEDRPGYIGMICSDMRPVEVIQGAVDDASFMCKRTFGEAPEVGYVLTALSLSPCPVLTRLPSQYLHSG